MRTISALVVITFALALTLSPINAQTSPAPIVKVEGLRQISSRVHIIPDNRVPLVPNVGFIVGDRAALVVDTGLGPPNSAAIYTIARKLAGEKAIYLVTTHVSRHRKPGPS